MKSHKSSSIFWYSSTRAVVRQSAHESEWARERNSDSVHLMILQVHWNVFAFLLAKRSSRHVVTLVQSEANERARTLAYSISNYFSLKFFFIQLFLRFKQRKCASKTDTRTSWLQRSRDTTISSIRSAVMTRILRADEYIFFVGCVLFFLDFSRGLLSFVCFIQFVFFFASLFCPFSFAFSISVVIPIRHRSFFVWAFWLRPSWAVANACDLNSKKVLKYHGKLIDAKRFIQWLSTWSEKMSIKCNLMKVMAEFWCEISTHKFRKLSSKHITQFVLRMCFVLVLFHRAVKAKHIFKRQTNIMHASCAFVHNETDNFCVSNVCTPSCRFFVSFSNFVLFSPSLTRCELFFGACQRWIAATICCFRFECEWNERRMKHNVQNEIIFLKFSLEAFMTGSIGVNISVSYPDSNHLNWER